MEGREKTLALKLFNESVENSTGDLESFVKEINNMKSMSSPHVVKASPATCGVLCPAAWKAVCINAGACRHHPSPAQQHMNNCRAGSAITHGKSGVQALW